MNNAFAKNIDEMMTYDQYRNLIKHCIDKVPDLQFFWKWQRNKSIKDVYAGGGRLRGLLLWSHQQLQKHSYEEVWNMDVPAFSQLSITSAVEVDKDLYVPDRLEEAVKEWIPDWDILDESFYQETLTNGGATLDKIRVSPAWIDDPVHGLDDFYHGRLRFIWSNQQSTESLKGDLKINLAIRFLRFSVDFKDILSPTAESLALVKKIPAAEDSLIPENPWSPSEFPKAWSAKIQT